MSIEGILSQLQKLRWSGTRGYAQCPAHNDQHSSLSLALGREQQLLVKCHAGCSFSDICEALKASPADFFATPASPLPAWLGNLSSQLRDDRIEAIYDYVNEAGQVLYQVVKFQGKQFRQRRPDGAMWVWNLNGVRKVLYRLPELIAAPPDAPVLICEGEKDVDNLIALDLVATTGPGGAGKWQSEFGDFLRGREVVILPDNDDPGRAHAKLVFKALWGIAKTIRILELPGLPEHGDVSDWLARGHENVEMDLAALISASPYLEPKEEARDFWWTSDLQVAQLPATTWVVDGLLPEGLTVLYGAPKIGKSWLALNLAVSVATPGALALGHYYAPDRKVIMVSYEDQETSVRERLAAHLGDRSWPSDLGVRFRLPKADKGGLDWLAKMVEGNPDIGMIVLDTLQLFRPARNGNGNRLYQDDVEDMAVLSQFAKERHLGLIALHHVRKTPSDDPIYKGSGTLGIPAGADTNWFMERTSDGELIQATLQVRGRHPGESEVMLVWAPDRCAWLQASAQAGGSGTVDRAILAYLATMQEACWPSEVADSIAVPVITVKRHLYRMVTEGKVLRAGRKYAILPDAPPPEEEQAPEESSQDPLL